MKVISMTLVLACMVHGACHRLRKLEPKQFDDHGDLPSRS